MLINFGGTHFTMNFYNFNAIQRNEHLWIVWYNFVIGSLNNVLENNLVLLELDLVFAKKIRISILFKIKLIINMLEDHQIML